MSKTSRTLVCVLVVVLVFLSVSNVFLYNRTSDLSKENNELMVRSEMPLILAQLESQVDSELWRLDENLLASCQQLSSTGLVGTQASAILTSLVASDSFIVNAATIDKNDVIVAVEPAKYSSIEGADISDQEQSIRLQKTMRPVMSNMIRLVEGFDGVVMAAPIFTVDKVFIGFLSIVIEPSVLLEAVATQVLNGTSYTAWAMQIDGRIIYDHDPVQQGKMLFSDPIYKDYPELLTLGRKISAERSGYGTYQYYKTLESGQVVKKEAYWTTIGAYDTEWRLVIIHLMTE